jgi:hypothetical protein
MKTASIHELKKEISALSVNELVELCIRLAKYKKENKELLNYLLFEAGNEESYVKAIKTEVREQFEDINVSNTYLAKKTIRKILRTLNKYIKYAASKKVETELLLFFCKQLQQSRLPLKSNATLYNIYARQVQKVTKTINQLHEDLQYDYLVELQSIQLL